jgi:hypothetical protein
MFQPNSREIEPFAPLFLDCVLPEPENVPQLLFKSLSEPVSTATSVSSSPRRHTICNSPGEREQYFENLENQLDTTLWRHQHLLFDKLIDLRRDVTEDVLADEHPEHYCYSNELAEATGFLSLPEQQYTDISSMRLSAASISPKSPHSGPRYFEDETALSRGSTPQLDAGSSNPDVRVPEPLKRRTPHHEPRSFWRFADEVDASSSSGRSHSAPSSPTMSCRSTSSNDQLADMHTKYVLPPISELRARGRAARPHHTRSRSTFCFKLGMAIFAAVSVLALICAFVYREKVHPILAASVMYTYREIVSLNWLRPVQQAANFLYEVMFEDVSTTVSVTRNKQRVSLNRETLGQEIQTNKQYENKASKQEIVTVPAKSSYSEESQRSLKTKVIDLSPLGALRDLVRRVFTRNSPATSCLAPPASCTCTCSDTSSTAT